MITDTIYTSSGIIRNASKPRIGILNANSEKLQDWIFDDINQGIDLDYEMLVHDLEKQGLDQDDIDEQLEKYESDCPTILFGDWIKIDGKYRPDKTKNFAAEYCNNHISVIWSKTTRKCNNTSPCYVMANGDGPCGDLDTDGTNVVAYDLTSDWYKVKT